MSQDLKNKIQELEKRIEELERDLIHDHLTSLKTRAFFEEETRVHIDVIFSPAPELRKEWFGFSHLSILFIDIDHFKNINDTYGHAVGDTVLRTVATAIQSGVREGDTVARWGGEEIVVSLLGADIHDAKDKAESIRLLVERIVISNCPDLKLSVSIGVSETHKGDQLEDVLKRADAALYSAKEMGRNRVVMWSEVEKE